MLVLRISGLGKKKTSNCWELFSEWQRTGRQSKSDLESDQTARDELFTRHLFFEVSLDFHDLMILHFHYYMSFGFCKMFSSIILRSIHCWTPFHLLLENWLLKNINGNITTSFRQHSLYILDYMFNTIKPIYKLWECSLSVHMCPGQDQLEAGGVGSG